MSDNGKNIVLGAGAGALGYALAKSKPATAASNGTDPSVSLLLQDIAETLHKMETPSQNGNGLPLNVTVSPLKNSTRIICFTVFPDAVGTPKQLPRYDVPDDKELVIKALPTNFGIIYVSSSQSNSTNPNQSYWLIANEGIGYKIKNSEQIWINCTIAGEGVVCTMEQN